MAVNRPCGVSNRTYAQDMAIVRTSWQWGLLIGGLILLFCLPLFAGIRILNFMNGLGITVLAVLGLNILMGYCGQISIGQSAFVCVGAYTSVLLVTKLGFPFLAALPCAALVTAIFGTIFGLPAARIKGFYLAMSTLAAQFIVPALVMNVRPDITGGTDAIIVPPPEIGGIVFNTPTEMFFIIMPITVIMTFFAKNLVRGATGRAFVAIRDNDLAAELSGINVFRYKLIAFFVCSLYAGVAGSLYAHWARSVSPDHFTLMLSILYAGMVIVGGMGSTTGAVLGAFFFTLLSTTTGKLGTVWATAYPGIAAFAQTSVAPIVYGLVITLFLIFEPRGLNHRWQVFKNSYRLYPFPY